MRATLSLLCLTAMFIAALQSAQAQPAEVNELTKLLAQDGMPGDTFGVSVAIEGDTAVIGAFADYAADNAGWAYVFERNGCSWTQVAKLWSSDRAPNDDFGGYVAISGNTIMVGATKNDNDNGVDAGAVYVFKKPTEGWHDMSQTCKLVAADGEAGDYLGIVAISGDTAVVGAPGDEDYGLYSGSAYVFERDGDCWTQRAKLWASDPQAWVYFGMRVTIQGDTILIGASQGGVGSSHPGSAYVFEKPPSGWVDTNDETAMLTPCDGEANDGFGGRVALSADASVILIGAITDDNEYGVNAGAAYVFERPEEGWVDMPEETHETHKITNAPYGQPGELFGSAVALDTCAELAVIGAYGRDLDCGGDAGAAYVFRYDGSTWNKEAKLTASDCAAGDRFGIATALSGDTAFVGAYWDDNEEDRVDAGAVYVFRGLSDCNFNSELDISEIAGDPSLDADSNGILDECEIELPVITCNGPMVLWSPDHDLIDVSSAFDVDDPDDDPLTLSFRVFSDEPEIPETGDGTGRHAPDFKDEHDGGRGLLVRSERRGAEDGRFYIFVITADDGSGGATTEVCSAAVVPHDQDQASLDDVLAQGDAAAMVVQAAVDAGDELPPPGLYEHGLADPLGPKQ